MINDIKIIAIPDALQSLRPGAQWVLNGTHYSNLVWMDENQSQPSELEVLAEVDRLKQEYEDNLYQRQRAAEYPSIADQLDTIFHGGIDAWKAEIQAVKNKYPKP